MPDDITLRIQTDDGEHHAIIPASRASHPLTDLLRKEALPLNTRCAERGLCQGCVIELLEGALKRTDRDETVRTAADDQPAQLRACQHALAPGETAVHIRIPTRSLLAHRPHAITSFEVRVPYAHDPMEGVTDHQPVGVAIDIGTTTVALMLVDLATGENLAQVADFNQQIHLGDNVLTRINLCTVDPGKTPLLQEAVVNRTIAPLLDEACAKAGISRDRLSVFACAGNTVMLHLLAGVNPEPLGIAPFSPVFKEHRTLNARQLELFWPMQSRSGTGGPARDDLPFHLLPSAAGYVGADLCAGAFATGLAYDEGPALLVDVGTNGEILLKHGDTLLGCATAAGPAFEGGMLDAGIRAGDGAISHIAFHRNGEALSEHASEADGTGQLDIVNHIIGPAGTRPIGICGSAYIDFLAQARRAGVLSPTGRFLPEAFGDQHHLLDTSAHANRFIVHRPADMPGQPTNAGVLAISETDIANLLQAKAAIAAGILSLLHRQQLKPQDIRTVYLAGGFGLHLDLDSAIGSGLLPGFTRDQIQLVGNTSLAGAYLTLIDRSVLRELATIADTMQVIELNLEPQFQDHFIDQLALP